MRGPRREFGKWLVAIAAASLVAVLVASPASASVSPVQINKSFGAATIPVGGSTSLSFSLFNQDETVDQSGIAFTDTLPAGLVVSTPNGLTGSCGGGTITAVAGSNSVSLTGATLVATAACTFSVNVTGTSAGTKTNSVTVSSTEGGTGNTATASITVVGPPTISKAFGAASIPVGGSTSLSFTISNPNASTSLTGIAFTDTLPAGLVISTPNGLTGSCGGGTITAVAGSNSVSLTGATLAGGASCTFSVNVTGTTAGVKNNSVQVTSTEGGTGNTATASITVVGPPTISKAFGAASIPLNGSTSLSFTIQNNNTSTTLTGVGFSDTLPAGLVISTPNGLTGSCGGGTITAVAGSNSVSLTGATLAGGASCTFSVNVTGTTPGTKNNSVTVSSTNGGTGNTAEAQINVLALPDLTISKTHRGQFKQLWFGTYTIQVRNVGGGLGTGMVTVRDTLPWSLFAIKMWGSGWTCNQGTLTCTRSDALAPGDSYPPIYLKVFVGVDTSLHLINVATVSNSLDTTSGNNTAFDPTTITPWTASLFFFF